MRILYFITGLQKSGAETQLFNLVTQLNKKKDVELKVVSLVGGYYAEKLQKEGIAVEYYADTLSYNMIGYLLFFMRKVKEFKPDIVHSFLFHTNIVSKLSLLCMKKSFKLICSYRDRISRHQLLRLVEKVNAGKCDLSIANSYQAVSELNVPEKKKLVIGNGVVIRELDKKRVKNLQEKYKEKYVVVTIGRVVSQKDYKTNIAVAEEVVKRKKECIFLYIGEGNQRRELEQLVEEKNLSSSVEFVGNVSDALEYLAIADVFFLPTLHESQCNVLLEAMALEKPIVTTNIAENKELVPNGLFCSPQEISCMQESIVRLLTKGSAAKDLKENKDYVMQEFSVEKMKEKYYKEYIKLVE